MKTNKQNKWITITHIHTHTDIQYNGKFWLLDVVVVVDGWWWWYMEHKRGENEQQKTAEKKDQRLTGWLF